MVGQGDPANACIITRLARSHQAVILFRSPADRPLKPSDGAGAGGAMMPNRMERYRA
jgi:hypothetical protein